MTAIPLVSADLCLIFWLFTSYGGVLGHHRYLVVGFINPNAPYRGWRFAGRGIARCEIRLVGWRGLCGNWHRCWRGECNWSWFPTGFMVTNSGAWHGRSGSRLVSYIPLIDFSLDDITLFISVLDCDHLHLNGGGFANNGALCDVGNRGSASLVRARCSAACSTLIRFILRRDF